MKNKQLSDAAIVVADGLCQFAILQLVKEMYCFSMQIQKTLKLQFAAIVPQLKAEAIAWYERICDVYFPHFILSVYVLSIRSKPEEKEIQVARFKQFCSNGIGGWVKWDWKFFVNVLFGDVYSDLGQDKTVIMKGWMNMWSKAVREDLDKVVNELNAV